MATTSPTPTTPTGKAVTAEKKPFSQYIGVDEARAGFGFVDDLAAAAALRREAKGQTQ
ncbi:hypothetical protein MZD04_gp013 [Pseudomonas phage Psa21]|uniref:Uncharacterized protein n=1 Tax=Pseudomonas phage Psa21 TaxID=2530023 RepID=A0A481W584_9CAUD|nr:hypothetical protein MZD04_gp013 [Pseudomonas phage Psa21]QBJ02543.1 hypothetical protein PSA21_13 [Pseudomonas phage Psa21]